MTNPDFETAIEDLHERLAETRERPVERSASRWIGEADAVAEDLVGANLDRDVIATRVGHVVELLSNVEETGDETADEHVDAARVAATALLEELEAGYEPEES